MVDDGSLRRTSTSGTSASATAQKKSPAACSAERPDAVELVPDIAGRRA